MSHRRGLMNVRASLLLVAPLAWAVAGCTEAPQSAGASQGANIVSQTAALEAGGPAPMMPPDEIVGPFSQDLAGLSLVYRYTTGGDYYITYGTDTVTFRLPLPDGSHTPPITVPYYVRKLRANMYLIHWVNPERTVHVTQVLDLPHKEVNVAALMPGQWQLFDVGHISESSRD